MGRRAKTKQGDPEPLAEVNGQGGRPSAKKLGKRKAAFEDDGGKEASSKRPVKKVKESSKKDNVGKSGKTAKVEAKKGTVKADKVPRGQKQRKPAQEEEESEAGSSVGWEDVQEEQDFGSHRKCVAGHVFGVRE